MRAIEVQKTLLSYSGVYKGTTSLFSGASSHDSSVLESRKKGGGGKFRRVRNREARASLERGISEIIPISLITGDGRF